MRKNKQIALRGALIALALVLSYLESFIPVFVFVPGMKIGLANIVTVIALFTLGIKDTVIISLGRIFLSGVLFGNITTIIYSIAGAAVSLLFMILVKRLKIFSVTGISIIGGITHNLGQIMVAAILLSNARIFYYMLILVIAGTFAGIVTGILAKTVMERVDFNKE